MNIGELFFTIESQGVNQVINQIDSLGRKLTTVGTSITMVGDRLYNSIGKPVAKLLNTSLNLASDLKESFNVVDTTFQDNAVQVRKWAKSLISDFGLTELESLNYVGAMGAMLKSSGLSIEASEEMSTKLVELTGDMSSFYNLDHEETWEKIRSGISGETEPLKQLGINMSVANLEAYALSKGINKSWTEMSQAEQVTLRYNYLLDATADAQGDFAKTADSYANKLRTVQGKLETFGVTIGNLILPYVEKFLVYIEKLINWLNNLGTAQQNVILILGLLAIAIPPLIITFGLLVTIVGTAVTGFVTLGGIMTTILSPVNLLLIALGLLTVGVGGAYLKTLDWKTIMENTKNFIMNSFVPALQYLATGEGLEKVQNASFITKTKLEEIRSRMIAIKNFINDSLVPALEYLATGEGLEKVQGASDNTKSKLSDLRSMIEKVRDWVKKLITKSKELVTELKDNAQPIIEATTDLFNELWTMVKKLSSMFKQLQNKTDSADDSLNDIKSTSSNTEDSIEDLAEGVSVLIDGFTTLARWAGNVADAIKAVDEWGDNAADSLDNLMEKIPGVKQLNSFLGFATGTRNFSGGWAVVGEQGAELVKLPKGSDVYNNDESKRMMSGKSTLGTDNIINTQSSTATNNTTNVNEINVSINADDIDQLNNVIDFFNTLKTNYNTKEVF